MMSMTVSMYHVNITSCLPPIGNVKKDHAIACLIISKYILNFILTLISVYPQISIQHLSPWRLSQKTTKQKSQIVGNLVLKDPCTSQLLYLWFKDHFRRWGRDFLGVRHQEDFYESLSQKQMHKQGLNNDNIKT